MVVSVVTRGLSDDCNSVIVDQEWVDLRIARNGGAFAFHYSVDGQYWHFVRLFALGQPGGQMHTGFLVQSPMGDGSSAQFSQVKSTQQPLTEYRTGA